MPFLQIRGIGATDTGRTRTNNEDAYHVDDTLGLFVVSDGMGGAASGEIASRLAVQEVVRQIGAKRDTIEAIRSGKAKHPQLRSMLWQAVLAANRAVYDQAQGSPENKGMGCTLTCMLIVAGHGVLAHVGDSRAYMLRDGAVHQLSNDHTLAAELVRSGAIAKDRARTHMYAHVLSRVIGHQTAVEVDMLPLSVLPGDRLLLCSDGLSQYLEDEQQLASHLAGADFAGLPAALIAHANQAGGRDNITLVLIEAQLGETPLPPRLQEVPFKLATLRRTFLFESLEFAQLNRVLHICQTRSFNADEVVFECAAESSGLLVLLEGELHLDHPRLGRLTVGPGHSLGAASLMEPQKVRSRVVVHSGARALFVPGERFRKLTRERPRLGQILLERLAGKLSRQLEHAYTRFEGEKTDLEAWEVF